MLRPKSRNYRTRVIGHPGASLVVWLLNGWDKAIEFNATKRKSGCALRANKTFGCVLRRYVIIKQKQLNRLPQSDKLTKKNNKLTAQ